MKGAKYFICTLQSVWYCLLFFKHAIPIFGNHLPCVITRITFYKIIPCLKFNYGNTANNSLTIVQAEKRIIHGCKYPGRFTHHSHDFLPSFNHIRARLILAIFQARYSHAVYFSFAFYVKLSKNKKGRKLFQACDQVAKFVESNYTRPFRLRSKNFCLITSKATKKPLPAVKKLVAA